MNGLLERFRVGLTDDDEFAGFVWCVDCREQVWSGGCDPFRPFGEVMAALLEHDDVKHPPADTDRG